MADFLVRLLVSGAVMGVLDAVWLSVVANKFYKSQIGHLLAPKPNMVAAVAFYVVYLIGVVAFVLTPAIDMGSWQYALCYGALFGLVAYATYDLTNLSTLKHWPTKVVYVDMAWGMALTAVVATVGYWVVRSWTL